MPSSAGALSQPHRDRSFGPCRPRSPLGRCRRRVVKRRQHRPDPRGHWRSLLSPSGPSLSSSPSWRSRRRRRRNRCRRRRRPVSVGWHRCRSRTPSLSSSVSSQSAVRSPSVSVSAMPQPQIPGAVFAASAGQLSPMSQLPSASASRPSLATSLSSPAVRSRRCRQRSRSQPSAVVVGADVVGFRGPKSLSSPSPTPSQSSSGVVAVRGRRHYVGDRVSRLPQSAVARIGLQRIDVVSPHRPRRRCRRRRSVGAVISNVTLSGKWAEVVSSHRAIVARIAIGIAADVGVERVLVSAPSFTPSLSSSVVVASRHSASPSVVRPGDSAAAHTGLGLGRVRWTELSSVRRKRRRSSPSTPSFATSLSASGPKLSVVDRAVVAGRSPSASAQTSVVERAAVIRSMRGRRRCHRRCRRASQSPSAVGVGSVVEPCRCRPSVAEVVGADGAIIEQVFNGRRRCRRTFGSRRRRPSSLRSSTPSLSSSVSLQSAVPSPSVSVSRSSAAAVARMRLVSGSAGQLSPSASQADERHSTVGSCPLAMSSSASGPKSSVPTAQSSSRIAIGVRRAYSR